MAQNNMSSTSGGTKTQQGSQTTQSGQSSQMQKSSSATQGRGTESRNTEQRGSEQEDTHAVTAGKGQSGSAMNSKSEGHSQEPQSLGSAIAKGLGIEDTEVIDRGLSMSKSYFDSAQKYVSSNPGEAVALAAAAGFSFWAALYTKPGQKAVESGKSLLWPQITKWISENLAPKKLH